MLRSTSAHLLLLALMATAGCATTAGTGGGSDLDIISRAEMQDYQGYDALQVIRRLRSRWLNDRGGSINVLGSQDIANPRGIRVYIDGVVQNDGLDELESLTVDEVSEIRKLDSSEATQRFGVGHTAGAILVTTIRSG